ncbi:hypothetical protein K9M48_02295 [Candidatus Gracilibacteria bacterium]|nr:hypothetical protein [Candidatus Gracilibacteria bacterium]
MKKQQDLISRIVSSIISLGLFFVGLFVFVGLLQVLVWIIAIVILLAAFTNVLNSFKK